MCFSGTLFLENDGGGRLYIFDFFNKILDKKCIRVIAIYSAQ